MHNVPRNKQQSAPENTWNIMKLYKHVAITYSTRFRPSTSSMFLKLWKVGQVILVHSLFCFQLANFKITKTSSTSWKFFQLRRFHRKSYRLRDSFLANESGIYSVLGNPLLRAKRWQKRLGSMEDFLKRVARFQEWPDKFSDKALVRFCLLDFLLKKNETCYQIAGMCLMCFSKLNIYIIINAGTMMTD